MRLVRMVLLALVLTSCASLTRTNSMLKSYRGKSIDQFMSERGFAYNLRSPLRGGGAVYQFSGGPGGWRCTFYITTDAREQIVSYRFEDC
jgi:hypothetical protein